MSTTPNAKNAQLLQQAALKLQQLQGRIRELEGARNEPIAIVGAGCRFPGGCHDLDSYWQFLSDGGDGVVEVPAERWDVDAYYDENPQTPGKTNTRRAGFLGEVDRFDSYFFGISPRESMSMDPQQRLFLEVAWEALEHAGLPAEAVRGSSTGVFVGAFSNDYQLMQFADPEEIDVYSNSGTGCAISGRLSYFLDLHGPCVAVDTACSSSLTAIHLACQSLRSGESKRAIAGGINLMLSPLSTVALSKLQALSPDGRCKAFDASADGMGRGEGCGVVVLERLSDALAAGRTIHALIRGSAVNQDGRSSSFTSPNALAQREVIRQALDNARVAPDAVSYIEAHGTGTSLGDPLEFDALTAIYGRSDDAQRCGVGSVKTNFGHLEAAAGMAGLLKLVCALEHQTIPAHLHFETLNPHIPLRDTRFFIPTETQPWRANGDSLIGAVSSFGLNGSNAHIVLEQAPAAPERAEAATDAAETASQQTSQSHIAPASELTAQPYILPLSARSPEALRDLAGRYRDLCRTASAASGSQAHSVRDLCWSASTQRSHLEHRLTVLGSSFAEFDEALGKFARGDEQDARILSSERAELERRHGVAYVFAPHGSQWVGLGRDLVGAHAPSEIRRIVQPQLERCAELMKHHVPWSLFDHLLGDDDAWLEDVAIFQPVLFALHMSLAALYQHWGVEADAVIGHSMGEIGAACFAGALSLEDAVGITCRRSALLRQTAGQGAMGVVELSMEAAREAIRGYEDRLAIAVNNSPRSTVLSGDPDALEAVFETLLERGVFCGWGVANVASHSPLMDQLSTELARELDDIRPAAPTLPIYSTVLGKRLPAETSLGARYWYDNLREPVLFANAVGTMLADGYDTFIELSAHPISQPALEDLFRHHKQPALAVSSMHREQPTALLRSVAQLYVHGRAVDLPKQYAAPARSVPLPSYPWQRERYWLAPRRTQPTRARASAGQRGAGHPFVRAHYEASMPAGAHYFDIELNTPELSYLEDHTVQDMAVVPAASYLEMALAGARRVFGPGAHRLQQVTFHKLLIASGDDTQSVQLALTPVANEDGKTSGTSLSFRVSSRRNQSASGDAATPWTMHVEGVIEKVAADAEQPANTTAPALLRQKLGTEFDEQAYHDAVAERGVHFGERFRAIRQVWRDPRELLTRIELPLDLHSEVAAYHMHPVYLDACFQGLGLLALLPGGEDGAHDGLFLPVGLESLQVHAPVDLSDDEPRVYFGHAVIDAPSDAQGESTGFQGDVTLVDADGRILVEARGLSYQRFDDSLADHAEQSFYRVEWQLLDPTRVPASEAEGSPEQDAAAGGYLLLLPAADDRDNAPPPAALDALREQLGADGSRCVSVTPGDSFALAGPEHYTVNPGSVDDFRRLFREAFGDERACRAVVFLWSLATPAPPPDVDALREAQSQGLLAVLHLVQALAGLGSRRPPRLLLVTGGVHHLECDADASSVSHSPIWGIGRTISHEFPEFRCTRIDVEVDFGRSDDAEASIAALARELRHPCGDDQLVMRAGAMYGARLRMWKPAQDAPESAALSADGTYLITGGTSGIGLELARWMVDRGVRHLVLASRSGGSDEARAVIDDMRARGAEVAIERVDIGDRESVAAMMERIDANMPPLRGLMHSAVVVDDGILLHLDADRFRPVLASKMEGAWLLHEHTRTRSLDFFVLFSSGNSLLGSPGEGSYAAANAFVDALAHHRRSLGLPGMSINWGPWDQTGLGAALDKRSDRIVNRGITGVSVERGGEAFGRLLGCTAAGSGPTQVGVFHLDLRQWQQYYPRSAQSPLLSELAAATRTSAGRRGGGLRKRLVAAPAEEREALLAQGISRLIADVLRLELGRISPDTPLVALGFDSLMAVELRNLLEVQLDATLPVTLIWGYPTVAALTPHLLRRLNLAAEDGAPESDALSENQATEPPDAASPPPQGSRGSAMNETLDRLAELSDDGALEMLLRGTSEKARR